MLEYDPPAVCKLLKNPVGVARLSDADLETLGKRYYIGPFRKYPEGEEVKDEINQELQRIYQERGRIFYGQELLPESSTPKPKPPELPPEPPPQNFPIREELACSEEIREAPPSLVLDSYGRVKSDRIAPDVSTNRSMLAASACIVLVVGLLSGITGGMALAFGAAWACWPLGIGLGLVGVGIALGITAYAKKTPTSAAIPKRSTPCSFFVSAESKEDPPFLAPVHRTMYGRQPRRQEAKPTSSETKEKSALRYYRY
jgi:hypothetical protein